MVNISTQGKKYIEIDHFSHKSIGQLIDEVLGKIFSKYFA